LIDVKWWLNADVSRRGYDFVRATIQRAPTLALLLTGRIAPDPVVSEMGDRTAIPPYELRPYALVVDRHAADLRASLVAWRFRRCRTLCA